MGRKGIATVEENEKGWFITYIDRDPETLKRQENLAKKSKSEKDYEERMAKIIEEQVERGKLTDKPSTSQDDKVDDSRGLERDDETKIVFNLPALKLKDPIIKLEKKEKSHHDGGETQSASNEFMQADIKPKLSSLSLKRKKEPEIKKSALDSIMQDEERYKAKKHRRDNWLERGIVVKIVANKLGDKYYKKKGVIVDIEKTFVGIVEMLDSGDRLKLDQDHLETVIPQVGRTVKVVNGPYAGSSAELLDVNFDKFCCKIKLESGTARGRVLEGIKYEDICKVK
jgi:DNA/RNA-binding protein KIN17